jgi:alpha-ketoglutarate-dependent taurine dioxygenase
MIMSSEVRIVNVKPLAAVNRELIHVFENDLVKIGLPNSDATIPLVMWPTIPDVSLPAWSKTNIDFIEKLLQKHGAVLFRGFGLSSQQDFESFLASILLERMYYMEGATPRTKLGDHIYTSTEFPADQSIAPHNELSYVLTWPMKVCFFCITPAEQGGETPIADVRKVYQGIPQKIRQRFIDKGWMLVRNFGDGLSLTWQSAFRTGDEAALEQYFQQARIAWEWKGEGRLRTRQVRPAVAKHPKTGETVWFNHAAFWHVSSLEPETRKLLLEEFSEEGLPYNTYYGDGSPIEDSVIGEIRQAYDRETVAFPWEKGDLLITDNMLAAHGRRPYAGQRKIIVSMGDPYTRTDL